MTRTTTIVSKEPVAENAPHTGAGGESVAEGMGPGWRIRRSPAQIEIQGLQAYIRNMSDAPNLEIVNDTAKLIMHRLIARRLAQDASLAERAKVCHAHISARHPGRPFVRDWNQLLALSANQLRRLLTSRNAEMNRLRLSSPFVITDGIDFTDLALRRRIRRAAKRVVERGIAARRAGISAIA